MIRRWEEFHGEPDMGHVMVPRVSLSKEGIIALNRSALELMGEPTAVVLLFDRQNNCIGLRPTSPKTAHSFRLHLKGRGRGRFIYARRFLNYYRLRRPVTIIFNKIERSNEGVLVLDLENVTEFVREKRNRGRFGTAKPPLFAS